jgi:hypothetical protein
VNWLGRWPCTTALCALAALAVISPLALVPLAGLVVFVTGWSLWHR